MIKILPVEEIREADKYTIKHEPIADIDLMERAAGTLYQWLLQRITPDKEIRIFCGTGNNGGDGLVLARLLISQGYTVNVDYIKYSPNSSASNTTNLNRLKKISKINIIEPEDSIASINKEQIVIDAIFGSGLTRAITKFPKNIIEKINNSGAMVISIDVPSGLFCDSSSVKHDGVIINADYTLTFQNPKLAFLFPENDKHVGMWDILDIGLHPDFLSMVKVNNMMINIDDIRHIIKKRKKYSHKGTYGHALLISGSYGKMGAAVLASKACLRTGVGLLSTHIPKEGYNILQSTIPEAMVSIDDNKEYFSSLPDITLYNAIGIGPGIGTNIKTQQALKLLIQNSSSQLVIDADAINILGENKTWLSFLPAGSILTPHMKEFERIAGKTNNNFSRQALQREFSIKYNVYVILKGAHSCISCPDGKMYFNTTGNPGMATAGSGDVLTGMILGLLAQHYHPQDAAIMGVFLHGLSGDIALKSQSTESIIASDIIDHIGQSFNEIHKQE